MVEMLKAKRAAYVKKADELYRQANEYAKKIAIVDEMIAEESVPAVGIEDEKPSEQPVVVEESHDVVEEKEEESEIIEIHL
jgi:hypothetical protein